jgi:protein CpxP
MKVIAAVVTSTFLMSGAYAQPQDQSAGMQPTHSASPAAMMNGDAKRNAQLEQHIKDLHASLKITPSEESQWGKVVQTMRDSASELDRAIDKRKETANTASAVDNLSAYGDIAQAHVDGVKKLTAAFSPLYNAMPDDQKKIADEVFAQRAHGGKKMAKATN